MGVKAAEHVMDRHKQSHTRSQVQRRRRLQRTHAARQPRAHTHGEHVFSEGQILHVSRSPLPLPFQHNCQPD